MSRRDRLFWRFSMCIFVLLILYGAGMILLTALADDTVALRLISGFSTMFAGFLGLGTGYILGQGGSSNETQQTSRDPINTQTSEN